MNSVNNIPPPLPYTPLTMQHTYTPLTMDELQRMSEVLFHPVLSHPMSRVDVQQIALDGPPRISFRPTGPSVAVQEERPRTSFNYAGALRPILEESLPLRDYSLHQLTNMFRIPPEYINVRTSRTNDPRNGNVRLQATTRSPAMEIGGCEIPEHSQAVTAQASEQMAAQNPDIADQVRRHAERSALEQHREWLVSQILRPMGLTSLEGVIS